ncbi:nicotinate-nucleotide adenylyltransferase [Porticoccus sp. W117]|uniref:nicotinate-nucleotide adenylyltransferase n=1 Tax=Porticoccus sp. W117 TaxID=3054777 RepID=UPI00259A356F|nr:nicotinate-nucleotide adenylyltransferase [Porticoccus sp. W117]MDM3871498.1 nicotinate-nucleotide adenylyltransferase [Porticoccus sp. W117]
MSTPELSQQPSVGLFGGTFNPVHIGHLRLALEIRQHLQLDEMRLMPCALPPHRDAPEVAAQHRLAMLQLAVAGEPGLQVDDRELRRAAAHAEARPSYTIDSVAELRTELGPQAVICLCIGMDSLLSLDTWHRWRELLDFVHLVVVARPGWTAPQSGDVAEWLKQHRIEDADQLHQQPAGKVWLETLTLLPVSSTEIRHNLAVGQSVRYLLPEAVIGYISKYKLYARDA